MTDHRAGEPNATREVERLRVDVLALLNAGDNLAAYAHSLVKLGSGTKDAMRSLLREYESRAERARIAVRVSSEDRGGEIVS
jgi:hypothetical protein